MSLKMMGAEVGFTPLPEFLPGEQILYTMRYVWRASGKSSPSYRLIFSIPPLWEAGFYVTDRRVILMGAVCRLLISHFPLWLPGREPPGEMETVKNVSTGHSRFGDYLEIISENPEKRWYRSHELRVRIYMRNPETLCDMISERLEGIPG